MKAILVAGLGFGDEGKGTIVDSLTRVTDADLVVRYNGGCQAAHHVVTSEGKEHCFSQFGAGTLAGARTYLSRYVMLDLPAMINEANHLVELGITNPLSLLTIDPLAPIITPYHRIINQLRERARGDARHGSCGRGIGALAQDIAEKHEILTMGALMRLPLRFVVHRMGTILERFYAEAKLLPLDNDKALRDMFSLNVQGWIENVRRQCRSITLSPELPSSKKPIIFEGAQGVLLDELHGFYPHTTWTNTTFANAEAILDENGYTDDIVKVGVTRSYQTRHGAGPMPTEWVLPRTVFDGEHNETGDWQGEFRTGLLDLVLMNYALRVLGRLDMIALTCVDRLKTFTVATRYETHDRQPIRLHYSLSDDLAYRQQITDSLRDVKFRCAGNLIREGLIEMIERETGVPVGVVSSGTAAMHKFYRTSI